MDTEEFISKRIIPRLMQIEYRLERLETKGKEMNEVNTEVNELVEELVQLDADGNPVVKQDEVKEDEVEQCEVPSAE